MEIGGREVDLGGIGAVVSAAGSAYSALQGSGVGGSRNKRLEAELQKAQLHSYTQGIRTRVADAKAAGLHPLFALGANTTFGPGTVVGDYGSGSTGSARGDALAAIGEGMQAYGQVQARKEAERRQKVADEMDYARFMADMGEAESRINLNNARRDEIERQYINSANKTAESRSNYQQDFVAGQETVTPLVRGGGPWVVDTYPVIGKVMARREGQTDSQTAEDVSGGVADFLYGPEVVIGKGRYWRNELEKMAAERREAERSYKEYREFHGKKYPPGMYRDRKDLKRFYRYKGD